jgi:hypothetical protein
MEIEEGEVGLPPPPPASTSGQQPAHNPWGYGGAGGTPGAGGGGYGGYGDAAYGAGGAGGYGADYYAQGGGYGGYPAVSACWLIQSGAWCADVCIWLCADEGSTLCCGW